MRPTPPKVLAVLPGFVPSTLIDVVKPFLSLERSGLVQFRIDLEVAVRRSSLQWPDLVIFCRNCEPNYASSLEAILQRGIPYIYDIDDNLFEVPPDTHLGRYHTAPERLAQLARYIQGAALVRVYSPPMLARALQLNPQVDKVVAPVDWRLISPPKPPSEDVVRIIYTTSREEDPLALLVAPALKRILEEFPSKVEVHFWGYHPSAFRDFKGVRFWQPVYNYDRFMRQFSRAGFDIGLAPLLDSPFYRSKTNNKFREYGACRIAGIYSDVEIYSACVENLETGLLVSNDPEAWYAALKRLVEDGALRKKIQEQAEAYSRQHYTLEAFSAVWQEQVQRVLAQESARQPVSAAVGAAPAPDDGAMQSVKPTARTTLGGILRKVRRRIGILRQGSLPGAWQYFSFQVYSWWLLFKLNVFKSL